MCCNTDMAPITLRVVTGSFAKYCSKKSQTQRSEEVTEKHSSERRSPRFTLTANVFKIENIRHFVVFFSDREASIKEITHDNKFVLLPKATH